jgi:hypothetical protein
MSLLNSDVFEDLLAHAGGDLSRLYKAIAETEAQPLGRSGAVTAKSIYDVKRNAEALVGTENSK